MEAEDAHPQMGMRLKHHLHEAGFADIRMTASFETYATPEEIEILYGIATNWFMSLSVTESAKMYGAATDEIFEEIGKAAEAFLQHPGAFAGIAFGQALAISPE